MATFDISLLRGGSQTPGVTSKASDEPTARALYVTDSTRMGANGNPLRLKGLGPAFPRALAAISACFLGVMSAAADPTTRTRPDPPDRTAEPSVPQRNFRPSWDLDGTYLWLGPTGAASYLDDSWDSLIGGQLAIIRVRERRSLGAVGGAFGASLWTARGGGRLWLDAIAGTRLGKMVGASVGPLVELNDSRHPRVGGSVGVWAFLGITPYARAGFVDGTGGFVEIGVHLALPAIRR